MKCYRFSRILEYLSRFLVGERAIDRKRTARHTIRRNVLQIYRQYLGKVGRASHCNYANCFLVQHPSRVDVQGQSAEVSWTFSFCLGCNSQLFFYVVSEPMRILNVLDSACSRIRSDLSGLSIVHLAFLMGAAWREARQASWHSILRVSVHFPFESVSRCPVEFSPRMQSVILFKSS